MMYSMERLRMRKERKTTRLDMQWPKTILSILTLTLVMFLAAGIMRADAVELTATWTGAGDGVNYSDSNNWDIGVVPLNNANEFIVIIPDGFTVNFDVPGASEINQFTLGNNSGLNLLPSTSLTVLGAAGIAGIIDADGGDFTADGAGVAFVGNRARVFASNGAIVVIAAPSYSSTGLIGGPIFDATDPTTVLNLSSVVSIDTGYNDGTGTITRQTITATNGAIINLSGLQTLTPPARGEDRIDAIISGPSLLDMSSLQTITGTGRSRFDLSNGAELRTGDLLLAARTAFTLNDATARLEGLRATAASSVTLNAPSDRFEVSGSLLLDSAITMEAVDAADGATVTVGQNYSFAHTDESAVQLAPAVVHFDGLDGQGLEVGGLDVGLATGSLTDDNFGLGQLIVGQDTQETVVRLLDEVDNGNRGGGPTEALYLFGVGGSDGLRIRGGSTLVIDNIPTYALVDGDLTHINALFPNGVNVIPFDEGFIALDIDNHPPNVDDQAFAVDENSPNGTVVGTVVASDPDGDMLKFSIIGGTGETAFAIDANSGEITVLDASQLDFETTPSFTLDVQVADTEPLFDTATITVGLSEVNEKPVVVSPIADLTVDEKSPPVPDHADLNVVFEDPDNDDNELTYTIEVNTNPDLVTPTIDTDGTLDLSFASNAFGEADITVRATDPDGLFADDSFHVTVKDIGFPPRGDDMTTSFGAFRILVKKQFQPLLAGFPPEVYDSDTGKLTSPDRMALT